MSANTFTLEAAAAANIQVVGSDTVSYTHLDVYKRQIQKSSLKKQ